MPQQRPRGVGGSGPPPFIMEVVAGLVCLLVIAATFAALLLMISG